MSSRHYLKISTIGVASRYCVDSVPDRQYQRGMWLPVMVRHPAICPCASRDEEHDPENLQAHATLHRLTGAYRAAGAESSSGPALPSRAGYVSRTAMV